MLMTTPGPVPSGPDVACAGPTWRTHSCVPCRAFEPDMSCGCKTFREARKTPALLDTLRAPSPTTPRTRLKTSRHACRYGTHECVRHVEGRTFQYSRPRLSPLRRRLTQVRKKIPHRPKRHFSSSVTKSHSTAVRVGAQAAAAPNRKSDFLSCSSGQRYFPCRRQDPGPKG